MRVGWALSIFAQNAIRLGCEIRSVDLHRRACGSQTDRRQFRQDVSRDIAFPAPYFRQGLRAGISKVIVGATIARQACQGRFDAGVVEGTKVHRCIMAIAKFRPDIEQDLDEPAWLVVHCSHRIPLTKTKRRR
jgi:hypothetical protein